MHNLTTKLKSLQNHQGFMRYFANTSWLFGEKILRIVVGLFVGIWVARYLGPEQFGLFSYAQSFVGLFAVIATLGLDSIVVRELVKDPSRRDELIGTSFWLKLAGAIAVLFILAIAVNFTSNDHYTNVLVFIIASATIFQAFNVVDIYFQAKVLSKYVVYANIFSLLISSVVKIALILYKAPLIAFAWTVLFDSLVLAVGFVYFFFVHLCHCEKQSDEAIHQLKFRIKNLTFSKSTATSLLKDSWPLIIGSLAATIYMQIDQVMIKEMMDAKSTGYYSVAVRLSDIWLFVTVAITKSLYPSIISAKNRSQELYFSRIQAQYDILIKLAVFISIIIFLFSEHIVITLFGEAYIESIGILKLYVWSIIFVYLSNGSWSYYISENLQRFASFRLIAGAIINISLNLMLIPVWGIHGAVIATLISYSISGYFINILHPKTRDNFYLQTNAIFSLFTIKYIKSALTKENQ